MTVEEALGLGPGDEIEGPERRPVVSAAPPIDRPTRRYRVVRVQPEPKVVIEVAFELGTSLIAERELPDYRVAP